LIKKIIESWQNNFKKMGLNLLWYYDKEFEKRPLLDKILALLKEYGPKYVMVGTSKDQTMVFAKLARSLVVKKFGKRKFSHWKTSAKFIKYVHSSESFRQHFTGSQANIIEDGTDDSAPVHGMLEELPLMREKIKKAANGLVESHGCVQEIKYLKQLCMSIIRAAELRDEEGDRAEEKKYEGAHDDAAILEILTTKKTESVNVAQENRPLKKTRDIEELCSEIKLLPKSQAGKKQRDQIRKALGESGWGLGNKKTATTVEKTEGGVEPPIAKRTRTNSSRSKSPSVKKQVQQKEIQQPQRTRSASAKERSKQKKTSPAITPFDNNNDTNTGLSQKFNKNMKISSS
jgi:hypothetical protein